MSIRFPNMYIRFRVPSLRVTVSRCLAQFTSSLFKRPSASPDEVFELCSTAEGRLSILLSCLSHGIVDRKDRPRGNKPQCQSLPSSKAQPKMPHSSCLDKFNVTAFALYCRCRGENTSTRRYTQANVRTLLFAGVYNKHIPYAHNTFKPASHFTILRLHVCRAEENTAGWYANMNHKATTLKDYTGRKLGLWIRFPLEAWVLPSGGHMVTDA
jgi:hypothetical protein